MVINCEEKIRGRHTTTKPHALPNATQAPCNSGKEVSMVGSYTMFISLTKDIAIPPRACVSMHHLISLRALFLAFREAFINRGLKREDSLPAWFLFRL